MFILDFLKKGTECCIKTKYTFRNYMRNEFYQSDIFLWSHLHGVNWTGQKLLKNLLFPVLCVHKTIQWR